MDYKASLKEWMSQHMLGSQDVRDILNEMREDDRLALSKSSDVSDVDDSMDGDFDSAMDRLAMAQTKTMVAGAIRWKTSAGQVTKTSVENNMIEKYMLAIAGLGIFFLALAVLETLINFAIWLYEHKRK